MTKKKKEPTSEEEAALESVLEAEDIELELAAPAVAEVAAASAKSDEFEQDGALYRRIHRLEGNRWIDRCERIG